jgi:hypothetical protein
VSSKSLFTMNTFEYYSSAEDVQEDSDDFHTSESVPQSTHPSLTPTSGYIPTAGPYVPDFDTTDYAAFLGVFTDLPTAQVDYTYLVSNQHA